MLYCHWLWEANVVWVEVHVHSYRESLQSVTPQMHVLFWPSKCQEHKGMTILARVCTGGGSFSCGRLWHLFLFAVDVCWRNLGGGRTSAGILHASSSAGIDMELVSLAFLLLLPRSQPLLRFITDCAAALPETGPGLFPLSREERSLLPAAGLVPAQSRLAQLFSTLIS